MKRKPTKKLDIMSQCAIVLAVLMACLLVGCDNSSESAAKETSTSKSSASATGAEQTGSDYVDASGVVDPIIQKTGWWTNDTYGHYGILIQNANQDYDAYNVQVEIAAFDQSGIEMSSSIDTIHKIPAGETIGFAGDFGNAWLPETVTFRVIPSSAQYKSAANKDDFSITEFSEQNNMNSCYEVEGCVTNNTADYANAVGISVLLFDRDQNILADYSGQACNIESDYSGDFLIEMRSAPDHALVRVYPQLAK